MKFNIINKYSDIHNVITECSDSFYDQKENNKQFIKNMTEKFSKYANFVLVTSETNEIIGFAAYYSNDLENMHAFLSMIIIKSAFSSKGVGSALLKYIISDCIDKGMKNIALEVNKNNSIAISFYKKFGFVFTDENAKSYFMVLNFSNN